MIDLQRAFTRLDTSRIWEHLNEIGAKLNEVIGRVNQVPVGAVVENLPASWTIGPNGTVPRSELLIENMKPADRWAVTAILTVTPNELAVFSLYVNGSDAGKQQLIQRGSWMHQSAQRWILTGYTGTVRLTLVASSTTGSGGTLNGPQSTFMAERIL